MRHIFRQFGKGKHVRKLFAAFCAVGLVMIGFTGIAVSAASMHVLERSIAQANRSQLQQFNKSIITVMSQADSMLVQFASDQRTRNFIDHYDSMDIDSINITASKLRDLLLNNQSIHSLALYYPASDRVYAVNSGVLSLDEYFDGAFLSSLNPDSGGSWTWSLPRRVTAGFPVRISEVISLVRPLKYFSGKLETLMVVSLDTGFFYDMFDSVAGGVSTDYFALDAGGAYIAGSGGSARYREHFGELAGFASGSPEGQGFLELAGEERLISYITCPYTGWLYFSAVSAKEVFQGVSQMGIIFLVVTLAGVILSTLLSLVASRRLAAPVIRLARSLNLPDPEGADLIAHIEEGVKSLRSRNESIEKALEESMPLLRRNFLGSVLTGVISDPAEIQENLEYFGIEVPDPVFVCVYALLTDTVDPSSGQRYSPRQISAFIIYTQRLLEGMLEQEGKFILCGVQDDEIAVIALLEEDDIERARERSRFLARYIEEVVSDERKHIAAIGMGEVHSGFQGAETSYAEARRALTHRFLYSGTGVIPYSRVREMHDPEDEYIYREEEKLISALRRGRLEDARASADRLLAPLAASGSQRHRMMFYLHLLGALQKYSVQCGALPGIGLRTPELYDEMLAQPDPESARLWFLALIDRIHGYNAMKQARPDRRISERIMAYIDEHYREDLSLTRLSREFYFSAPYLSRIFHEETGVSVKQYITKVRMDHACLLLRDPALKVTDVARMVGYDKVHGFLKQFKELTGATPSGYRESLAEDRLP